MVSIGFAGQFRIVGSGCILLWLVYWLTGCSAISTQKAFYEPITAELRENNFSAAVQKIEAAREKGKYPKKDRFLYYIDAGLAYHYASEYDSSIIRLTLAEDAADELFTRSISRAAVSLVLNDNILEYAGEDYEILYTNLIKAVNFVALDKFDEAFVEIRRANDKLDLLEYKYREAAVVLNEGASENEDHAQIEYKPTDVRFNNDAFARYLSMHMYATDRKMDDARIDYELMQQAFQEQPHIYGFPPPEVKYYSKDRAIISFIALAGLAPVKEELGLRIRTDKDLDLVQVLYTDPDKKDSEYGHLPLPVDEDYYFKFSIPQLVERPSVISEVRVLVDGRPKGYLQLIEDVATVAGETFKAKKSIIYLRSLARAIFKGLAAHRVKEGIDKKDDKDDGKKGRKKDDSIDGWNWLKKLAVDVAADISENADLRCSRLLPGRILVGDFEIDPGTYNLTFEFLDAAGEVISTTRIDNYQVLEDGLNMVHAVSLK